MTCRWEWEKEGEKRVRGGEGAEVGPEKKSLRKKRKSFPTHRVNASTEPTAAQSASPPPSPARRNANGSESTPAPIAELQRVKTEEAEVAPEAPPSEPESEEAEAPPSVL